MFFEIILLNNTFTVNPFMFFSLENHSFKCQLSVFQTLGRYCRYLVLVSVESPFNAQERYMCAYTHTFVFWMVGENPEYAQLKYERDRSRRSFWSPLKPKPKNFNFKVFF